jgi:hypothetical protein
MESDTEGERTEGEESATDDDEKLALQQQRSDLRRQGRLLKKTLK